MLFCPECANLLLLNRSSGSNTFPCRVCPYILPIEKPITKTNYFEPKKIDDIIAGEEAWKNVDSTEGISIQNSLYLIKKCSFKISPS